MGKGMAFATHSVVLVKIVPSYGGIQSGILRMLKGKSAKDYCQRIEGRYSSMLVMVTSRVLSPTV